MTPPVDVLVVEDDVELRQVLSEVLTDAGYRVASLSNGRDALRSLKRRKVPPRLILLDLMMPVMDGWKFLEEKSRLREFDGIPVVVLSAFPARNVSAQAILRKPIDLNRLTATVEKFCRKPARRSPSAKDA